MAGLNVFPERMRANLDGEGGLIMAEAAMMACPMWSAGQTRTRSSPEASSAARGEGLLLRITLERGLDPAVLAALPTGPALGESDAIVTAAIDGGARSEPLGRWNSSTCAEWRARG